ncbi:hypothetical protein [Streptomyces hokutonensis]|uniref:hypothetical protein n=1 Tax=Streptomyces hokutonensis TaxID=1306990 RepID=UPI00380327D3
MHEALITAVGMLAAGSMRLLHRWLIERSRIEMVRAQQEGTSDRVRVLPPGSVLNEVREGEEVRIEIGGGGRG